MNGRRSQRRGRQSDANVHVAPHDVASALLPGSLKFVAATP